MNTFSFPEYANRWDVAVVSALLTDALAQGWTVSVDNGGYYDEGDSVVIVDSADAQAISAEMMSTDTDLLTFRKSGHFVGTMLLVWGNSGECYADSTIDNGGPFDQFTDRVERSINDLFNTGN